MSGRQERSERTSAHRCRPLAGALALVAVVVGLAACSPGGPRTPTAEELVRIDAQETFDLLQRGEAALYDVRPLESYQASHAEGAISLPEAEAVQRLAELPDDRLLVFY